MSVGAMRTTTALLVASAMTTGCFSTSHQPRDHRKVYMTMQDGMRGYARGGQFHSEMGFGGGLVDAVQGNPRAAEAADTFRDRMILGFLGLVGGAVCLPVVGTYAVVQDSDGREVSNSLPWIALGCTAAMIIGAFSMASAMPYQFDAINIYNDDVDAATYQQQWTPPRFPQPAPIAPVAPVAPVAPMAPEPPMPAGPGGF